MVYYPTPTTPTTLNNSYEHILIQNGVTFRESLYYLHVESAAQAQGWLLHISVALSRMADVLTGIMHLLISLHIPYKVVKTLALHEAFNNGDFSIYKTGKIITLFIADGLSINNLIEDLRPNTDRYAGPPIITDLQLSDSLFVRYGAFDEQLRLDGYGRPERVIMNSHGRWVPDRYVIPPAIPTFVQNPFATNKHTPKAKIIATSEQPKSIGIAIKRGNKQQMTDRWGRNAADRIRHQFYLAQAFRGEFPIAPIIDYGEDNDGATLTCRIPEGKDVFQATNDILTGKVWPITSVENRIQLLKIAVKMAYIIEKAHMRGVVLRDIHPRNFHITSTGEMLLLDWTLAYAPTLLNDGPAFQGGTKGFINPFKPSEELPLASDDVYAFGATFLFILTGISPYRLLDYDTVAFARKLMFLLKDPSLVDVLKGCLKFDSSQRPEMDSVRMILQQLLDEMSTSIVEDAHESSLGEYFTKEDIRIIVGHAIRSLVSPIMTNTDLWFSVAPSEYGRDVYPLESKYALPGLAKGVSGVLYLVCKLREMGYNVDTLQGPIDTAQRFIWENNWSDMSRLSPGLYQGTTGQAVALLHAYLNGLLPEDNPFIGLLGEAFAKDNPRVDIAQGLAGDGMALLQCNVLREAADIDAWMEPIAAAVIRLQLPNGSWKNAGSRTSPDTIYTGFAHGVAGITYFLLELGHYFRRNDAWLAAMRGLDYLDSIAIQEKDITNWPDEVGGSEISGGWDVGGPGIALAYLKSYEYSGNRKHLATAEAALRFNPGKATSTNLTLSSGLAGLGEIYLEAYRVTRHDIWQQRADWIAQWISGLRIQGSDEVVYWLSENGWFPTADLMTGNSGVIHFLARYNDPEHLGMPVCPSASIALHPYKI